MSNDAVIVHVDVRELSVCVPHVDLHTAMSGAGSGTDLSDLILESMRQLDSSAMFRAGDGIPNGLRIGSRNVSDVHMGFAGTHIDRDIDRSKDGLVNLLECRSEDSEHGRKRIRILPRHDLEKRFALLVGRSFVDEPLAVTVALVNGIWPLHRHACG
jgi:hypothetical protein